MTAGTPQAPQSLAELWELLWSVKAAQDEAKRFHDQKVQEAAAAERDYRLARARAWLELPDRKMIAKEREDHIDSATARDREKRDIAEGLVKSALENVRDKRQEMSAWQSFAAGWRAEAEWTRTAPREVSP